VFVYRELILMNLDFQCASLHIEYHVILSRVLRPLHLILPKLHDPEAIGFSNTTELAELEGTSSYI
jgi:hypothetical protein